MAISIRTKRGIFFGFIFFVLVGILLSMGLVHYLVRPSGTEGPDQIFTVREGATLREIAGNLEKSGIITSKTLILVWSKITGYGTNIKAGEYSLNSNMPPLKVLDILRRGLVIRHSVTIPEGFALTQIARELEKNDLVDTAQFLALATDPNMAAKYGLSEPTLEGYLYPDTYRFFRGQSPLSIIDAMMKRFFEVISPLRTSIEASGMTLNQVITLASLIEKETGQVEERPVIASVFLNRLKHGMRLESDPTVIYGIKDFNGNLTKPDLTQPTPYNTYVIPGLPPGPIASPGKESIQAVLFPAKTDYLYFVSKNDGTHQFSKSLAEHNKAVNIYQKKGRRNDGQLS